MSYTINLQKNYTCRNYIRIKNILFILFGPSILYSDIISASISFFLFKSYIYMTFSCFTFITKS